MSPEVTQHTEIDETPVIGTSGVPLNEVMKSVLTIKQAVEQYRSKGQNCVSPTFRALINQMIDTNVKTEFENDSYADALFLTDVMFARSQKSIRILTGDCGGEFLSVLQQSFENALERIRDSHGSVRIVIVNGEGIPDWLSRLTAKFGILKVAGAKSDSAIKHFIVCDAKMARLEEEHGALSPDTLAGEIKARVYFNEPAKTRVFEQFFDSIWKVVATK